MAGESERSDSWPPRIPVCVGAVVTRGSEILLIRQAEGHSLAGRYSIPWGLVDEGEAPDAAVLREIAEESGVTARIEGLMGFQNLPQEGWIALVFLCSHVDGTPVPDGTETDRAGYFACEEIRSLPLGRWCAWLIERRLAGKTALVLSAEDDPYAPKKGFLYLPEIADIYW